MSKPKEQHNIQTDLLGLKLPIKEVFPDEQNANVHPQRSIDALAESLNRYGQRRPVVARIVGDSLVLEAGEGIYRAALQLGWSHLAVLVVEDSDTDATGFALADNQLSKLSSWDAQALERLLTHLRGQGDLEAAIGFNDDELDMMLARTNSMVELLEKPAPKSTPTEPVAGPAYRPYQIFVPVDRAETFDAQVKRLGTTFGTHNFTDTVLCAVRFIVENP